MCAATAPIYLASCKPIHLSRLEGIGYMLQHTKCSGSALGTSTSAALHRESSRHMTSNIPSLSQQNRMRAHLPEPRITTLRSTRVSQRTSNCAVRRVLGPRQLYLASDFVSNAIRTCTTLVRQLRTQKITNCTHGFIPWGVGEPGIVESVPYMSKVGQQLGLTACAKALRGLEWVQGNKPTPIRY